jgi:hypothetical protein
VAEFKTYPELDTAIRAATKRLAKLVATPHRWRKLRRTDLPELVGYLRNNTYICGRCGEWTANLPLYKTTPCWRDPRGN